MKRNTLYLLTSLSVLIAASCKKDEKAPDITNIYLYQNGSLANSMKFNDTRYIIINDQTSSTKLEGLCIDDNELKSMDVTLHDANDNHVHAKTTSFYSPLETSSTFDYSGKEEQQFSFSINHDTSANIRCGLSDLIFSAEDAAGNATSFANEKTQILELYFERKYQADIFKENNLKYDHQEKYSLAAGTNFSIPGYIQQARGNRGLSVSFISIKWINNGTTLLSKEYGNSTVLEDGSNNTYSGETMPVFSANHLSFADLNLGSTTVASSHTGSVIQIMMEDEKGNCTYKELELVIN